MIDRADLNATLLPLGFERGSSAWEPTVNPDYWTIPSFCTIWVDSDGNVRLQDNSAFKEIPARHKTWQSVRRALLVMHNNHAGRAVLIAAYPELAAWLLS